jgi:hypothetical protein
MRETKFRAGEGVEGTTEPRPDPGVVEALALGWHVAEMYHFERMPVGSPETDRLPGIGSLDSRDRKDLLEKQLDSGIGKLGLPVKAAQSVLDLHKSLLMNLTVKDATQGNAYGLGRALAETVLLPEPKARETFESIFNGYRIETIKGWLGRLDASLPKYAAAAVRLNLVAWEEWVALTPRAASAQGAKQDAQRRQIQDCLRRQGDVWFGLLSGELRCTSLLSPQAYLTAGEALAGKIGRLAWRFLWTRIGLLLTALIVALAALSALVWATGHQDAMAGTVALLFGALGITAGGAAASVRQVLQQAQSPIWEAELVGSVAAAALRLPDKEARRALMERPEPKPRAAPALPQDPVESHTSSK